MNVMPANYPDFVEQARQDLKQIEKKGTSRAETLEDLRDTTGKSFRTLDLENLMQKYDPKAYAQYSNFAKGTGGARTQSGLSFLSNWVDSVKKGLKDGTIGSGGISQTNESKLSSKAQDFLKNLREKYGDYDFLIGNSTDNLKSLVKSGSKEFTVVFSNTELERMAGDEKYAEEKLQSIETAVRMSEKINQQFGFQRGFLYEITKLGMVFNDDGTTKFFAELRNSIPRTASEKHTNGIQSYAKNGASIKHTNIQANSMEELIEKINSVDWNSIKSDSLPENGSKFDFSI